MTGVETQFVIQDRMTAPLERIAAAASVLDTRLDSVSSSVDSLSSQMASQHSEMVSSINRASDALEQMNNRTLEAEDGAKKVKNAWSGVGGYIRSAMAAMSVQQVVNLADNMTGIRARLDLMNDGLQTTAELQKMIMESANRSRTLYQSQADAISKMGIMARDAFSSNEELIQFTELIGKQFTIAGTSAAGIDAAMLQLTQAMSSGVLRGEELNSVFEQAPTIIQTIADYLGVSIGEIREMAAEGQITATVVKNAMLSSADAINTKFESMPMTFSQLATMAGNVLMEAFMPVLTLLGQGAQWIYDNWSMIAPIFWGVAAAAIGYAAALGIQTAATWIATGAAKTFFTTLLTNPLFWIALAIGVVVAAIYRWVQSVGGLQVAWLICVNAVLTAWDMLKIGFMIGVYAVLNLWDRLQIGLAAAGAAIQISMGNTKALVLSILQDMINRAINMINGFIGMLNKIPGVSIDLIEQVTFGTEAQLQNEANKQAALANLADRQNQLQSQIDERAEALQAMRQEADANRAAREAEIAAKKAEVAASGGGETGGGVGVWQDPGGTGTGVGDVGEVGRVGSVGEIEQEVDISDEDLKFMKDVAEMRYVQNFVTLTPTVAMNAQISEKVDAKEVIREVERQLEEEFEASAEGVYG